jgi:arylsulfatase A-like enzyme/Flp pilus assembly protein TadD
MYGYRGVQTPALNRFRKDAILFEHAWSHTPLTLPSHATMLTGLLPPQHGVRDNTGFRLPDGTPTLASILASHGYATGAAVSAYVLRGATGIGRGFGDYDDRVEQGGAERAEKSLGAVQRNGNATAAVAKQWIGAHAGQPFFYFLHLYEPHAPYAPPPPYPQTYDGEVAATDAIVGDFLDFLRQQGLYDRALILFVSDHGEGLGDHGEEEHGIFLYRESLAVPMVVKLPQNDRAGSSSSTTAGLADVTPTILDALGIKPPRLDGRALLSDSGSRPIYSETYYPRFHFGWSDLHSLIVGDAHYIAAPREELYDLARDPAERTNRLEEDRRGAASMRAAIRTYEREPAAPSPVSKEEAEKLAALGYIGSSSSHSGPLADPKDKIGTFRELQSAFRLYREHRDSEALTAFDALLKREPDLVDLWDVRSKVLVRLGRPAEAIESGKEALRRNPSAAYLAADLANEMLLAGDADGAETHARLALAGEPAKAHEILARIALVRGDLTKAESEAKAAGDSNAALFTLARVQQKHGDFESVVATTGRIAADMHRPLVGVHAMRGDALARLGRNAEAESELRAEIALFPTIPDAYRSLVVLLLAENRPDDATRAILALATVSPKPETYRAIAEIMKGVGDEAGARYWAARAK